MKATRSATENWIRCSTRKAYSCVCSDKDYAFWLGNDLGEETRSRFNFMGAADGPNAQVISYRVKDRSLVVRADGGTTETSESIFDYLARALKDKGQASEDLPFDFNCGFAGYFGYELKAETGGRLVHASALPDAMFIFCDRMIVFDQSEGTTYLVAWTPRPLNDAAERWFDAVSSELPKLRPTPEPGRIYPDDDKLKFRFTRSYETYIADIGHCLDEIVEGESYEICLTNQLHTDPIEQPLNLYRICVAPIPHPRPPTFTSASSRSSAPPRAIPARRARRPGQRQTDQGYGGTSQGQRR